MEQNYYKKNKGKYSYLLLVIFSLFFLTLALCLINFTHDDPESKNVLPFLLIMGGFSLFIFIVSSIAQIQLLVKSKNEAKVLEEGFSSIGKIKKIIFSEAQYMSVSSSVRKLRGASAKTLYYILISYKDKNGIERLYKPSLKFNRTDINYLLYKNEFAVVCNEKCCVITEQIDNAYSSQKDLIKEFMNEKRDDPLLNIKTPDQKRFSYKLSSRLIVMLIISVVILPIIIYCTKIVIKNSNTKLELTDYFLVLFIISAIYTLIKLNLKSFFPYIINKKGTPNYSSSFDIYTTRLSSSPRIRFKYVDAYGKTRQTSSIIRYRDVEIAKSMDKLPIKIYKKYAIVDYDRFPKI